jgi:hypothetical protein
MEPGRDHEQTPEIMTQQKGGDEYCRGRVGGQRPMGEPLEEHGFKQNVEEDRN